MRIPNSNETIMESASKFFDVAGGTDYYVTGSFALLRMTVDKRVVKEGDFAEVPHRLSYLQCDKPILACTDNQEIVVWCIHFTATSGFL